MSDNDQQLMNRLLSIFAEESAERMEAMTAGLMEIESKGLRDSGKGSIESLYREMHSLKGAARSVDLEEIEQSCQQAEDLLAACKRGESSLDQEGIERLHVWLGYIQTHVARACGEGERDDGKNACESEAASSPTAAELEHEQQEPGMEHGTMRIGTRLMDRILRRSEGLLRLKTVVGRHASLVGELIGTLSATAIVNVREVEENLIIDQLRIIEKRFEEDGRLAAGLVDRLTEDVMDARLVPFSIHSVYLQKTARDLARKLGKSVHLNVDGAESRMDKRLLEVLKDPLIHLVRNSVDHGIEHPEERVASGKPASGRISIQVQQNRRDYVRVVFEDDGRGIDGNELAMKAVESGLIPAAKAGILSEQEKLSLILESGVSTSKSLTTISGRGLGMAIVREAVEKIGGSLQIRSKFGRGTSFVIDLPTSVTTFHGTLVTVGANTFIIPTRDLIKVVRRTASSVFTVENRTVITFDERPVSLELLGTLLGEGQDSFEHRTQFKAAIVGTSGGTLALVVDEILRDEEIFCKELGPLLERVPGISGAAVLEDGRIALVIQVDELIRSASGRSVSVRSDDDRSSSKVKSGWKATVLLAEDSATTRTQLEAIIREAGYQVISVPDGESAREALEHQAVDIVVSDVDMPGMNGFELVRSIRSSATHSGLPVIMVTSRETEKDRMEGLQAGADAYLQKSTFNQGKLLRILARFA